MLLTLLVAVAATPVEDPLGLRREAGEERFVYSAEGRRDPFLFRGKEEKRIIVLEPPISWEGGAGEPEPVGAADLAPLLGRAQQALEVGDLLEAKRLAELVRRGLEESYDPELAPRLEGIREALRLLAARKRAEEAFERLLLTVDAIYWSQDEPVAVISGVVRREGDLLEGGIQVHRIGKGEVVFLYENYLKVRKKLNWSRP